MMPGPANQVQGGSSNNHQKDLCMQLWQLRSNFTLCDVALKVGGTLLPAHRIVLCACSPFFLVKFAVLSQSMEYLLDLTTECISYDTCQSVLEYMYTGVVPKLPKKRLPELDWLIEHWQLTSLQTKLASKNKNKREASTGKTLMVSSVNKHGERREALAVSTINHSNHDHPYFKDVYKGKNVEPGQSILKSDISNSTDPLPISLSSDELVEEEFCECEHECHDDGHDEYQMNSNSDTSTVSVNKMVIKEETDSEELLCISKTPSPAIQYQVWSTDYQDPTDLENEIYKCLTSSDTKSEDVEDTSCIENGPVLGISRSEEQSIEADDHKEERKNHLGGNLCQQDLHLDSDTQVQPCSTEYQTPPDEENHARKEDEKYTSCIENGPARDINGSEAQSIEPNDQPEKRLGHLGGNLLPQDSHLYSESTKEVAQIMLYMEEGSTQAISGGATQNAELDEHLKRKSSQHNERSRRQLFQLNDDVLFQMHQGSASVEDDKFLANYETKEEPNIVSQINMMNYPPHDISGCKVLNIEPNVRQEERSYSKEDTKPVSCTENGPPQGVSVQNAIKEAETKFVSFTNDLEEERSGHFDEKLQRQHFQVDGLPELEDINFNENLVPNNVGCGGELKVCDVGLSEQTKLQPDAAMQYTGGKGSKGQNMNEYKIQSTKGNGQEISTAKTKQGNSKTELHSYKDVRPCLPEQAELPRVGVFLQPQVGKDKVLDVQNAQSLPYITPKLLSIYEQNCEPVQFSQAEKTEDQIPKVVQCSQSRGTGFQSRNTLQQAQVYNSSFVLLKIVKNLQTERPMLQSDNEVQYVLAKDTGLRQSEAILQLEDQTAKYLSPVVVQHGPAADRVPQHSKPIYQLQAQTSNLQKANGLQYMPAQQANVTELQNNEATQRLQTGKTMHKDLQHRPEECTEKRFKAQMFEQQSVRLVEYVVASQTEAQSCETLHSQAKSKTQGISKVILGAFGEEDSKKTSEISFPFRPIETNQSLLDRKNKDTRILQTKKRTLQLSPTEKKAQCLRKVIFVKRSDDLEYQQAKRPETKQAELSVPDEKESSHSSAFFNAHAEIIQQRCLPSLTPKPQNRGLSPSFPATDTQHRASSPYVQTEKMAPPTSRVTRHLPDEYAQLSKEIPQEKTVMQIVTINKIGKHLCTEIQKAYEEGKLFNSEITRGSLAEKTDDTESENVQQTPAGNGVCQGLPPTRHKTGELVPQPQHVSKKHQSRAVKRLFMKKKEPQSLHLQPAKKLKLENDEFQMSFVEVNDGKMFISNNKVEEVQHQNTLQKLQSENTVLNEAVNPSQVETGEKPQLGKKIAVIGYLQEEKTKLLSANAVQDLPRTNHKTGDFVQQSQHVTKKQRSRVVERLLMKKKYLLMREDCLIEQKMRLQAVQAAKKLKLQKNKEDQALFFQAVQKLTLQNDEEIQMSSVGKVKVEADKDNSEVTVPDTKCYNMKNNPEPSTVKVKDESNNPEPPAVKRKDYMSHQHEPPTVKRKDNSDNPQPSTVKVKFYNTKNNPEPPAVKRKNYMSNQHEPPTVKRKDNSDNPEPPTVKVKFYNAKNNPEPPAVKRKNYMSNQLEPPTVKVKVNGSNNLEPPTVKRKDCCESHNPKSPTVKVKESDISNNSEPPTVKTQDYKSNHLEPPTVKKKDYSNSYIAEPATVKKKDYSKSYIAKPATVKTKYYSKSNIAKPPTLKTEDDSMSYVAEPPTVKTEDDSNSYIAERATVKKKDYSKRYIAEPATVKTEDDNNSYNAEPPTVKTEDDSNSYNAEPPTVKTEDDSNSYIAERATVKKKDYSKSYIAEPATVKTEDDNNSAKPPTVKTEDDSNSAKPPTVKTEDDSNSAKPPTVKTEDDSMSYIAEPPTVKTEDYNISKNPEPPTVKTIHNEHYICTDCLMLFEDHAVLTVHRCSFHKKTEQYTCDICNLSFDVLTQLQRHDTEHHFREGIELELTFGRENVIQARNAECHREMKGEMECDVSSSARHALNKQVHKYSRKEERKKAVSYYCEHPGCPYRTYNMKILCVHHQLHAVIPAKKHLLKTCEECGKSYLNAKCLDKHKKQNHERVKLVAKERMKCTSCAFSSLSKSNLAEHRWKKHDSAKEGKPRYQCTVCGFKTLQLSVLSIHKTTHKRRQNKTFACKVCKKSYHKAAGLKKHMIHHTGGAKLYACPYCDYVAVNNKTTLQTHIELMHEHKGEKRFPCDECEYACNYKGNLYSHMRKVHKRNPCLQGQGQMKTKNITKLCLQENTQRKTKKKGKK